MPPERPLSLAWFYDMDALRSPAGVTRHALAMRFELAKMPEQVKLQLATGRIREPDNLATWETWDDLPRRELPLTTRHMLRYWRLCDWPPLTTWTGPVDWIYTPAEMLVSKGKSRLAVTSHDILQDLKWQPPRRRALLDKLFQAADHVFSVSHFNTIELLKAYPRLEGRISVVPNAADDLFYSKATEEERRLIRQQLGLGAETRFLLSVANFQPRKNLDRLIQAVSRLKEVASGEMAVVLVGEGSEQETRRLVETIQKMRSPKMKIQLAGYLQGISLRAAFAEAQALVFPSLCESFGIPVLEAMSQGCPLALADSTGLPEVAREAGWYFDPTSEEAIAASIRQIIDDSKIRDERIRAGEAIFQEFSWRKSAEIVVNSLRQV